MKNNLQQQSYPVNSGQMTISTCRGEIRRLKAQFEIKDEQNRKLADKIQGLHEVVYNSNNRINHLTIDLEKQKRIVGKYSIQVDTLKNELQAGFFLLFNRMPLVFLIFIQFF